MIQKQTASRRALLAATTAGAVLIAATPALADPIDIKAQPAASALRELAAQTNTNILFQPQTVAGLESPAIQADISADEAARRILAASNLRVARDASGALIVSQEGGSGPQGAGAGAGSVDALIVTAQKREENIQDVPIAISAFSQEALEAQKIEGGFDLLKAIPNVTFSKNNFTSYNFSIRGIGTKAVSATTDPGVAVSFNNTALLQNRLFEQEYFDVERVEVLRGPQGTLYGRNATAGVINVISAKPDMNTFAGSIKGEVGNYNTQNVSSARSMCLWSRTFWLYGWRAR